MTSSAISTSASSDRWRISAPCASFRFAYERYLLAVAKQSPLSLKSEIDIEDLRNERSSRFPLSMSVVDGELKVYGIDGLRIADSSIMPRISTGNTMAPCVVIGERAADLIRKMHGLQVCKERRAPLN
jgi:hypothetical protein